MAVVVHGHRRADALGRAAGRAGPGAAGCRGQRFLAPAAKLAHAPATGGAFVGHTAVFHHVLEHLRHRVPPGAGTGAGGRARGMGVFPAAVSRAAGAVHAVHRSDADARCQIVEVTPAGQEMGLRMIANRERTGGLLLQGMDATERKNFIRLLTKALANVSDDR